MHSLEQFFNNVCTLINRDTLIIFDDMPRFTSKLWNFFSKFINECSKHNIKVITTSPNEIPFSIKQTLEEKVFSCIEIPKLSNNEILDILNAYNAPEYILNEKLLGFIAAKTQRHPSLVCALCNYLSIKEWKFNFDTLEGILNNNYSTNLESEIQSLVIESINSVHEKELLYRLSIIDGPFTFDEVTSVCNIEPIIELPMENFENIKKLWFTQESELFIISPLIKKIAEKNITLSVKRSVNLAMATTIMKRKSLSPPEIMRAIIHFSGAEEFNDAGLVLIRVLNELDRLEINSDEWSFTSLWYGMELPPKMHIKTKLCLRVLQVKCCLRIGKDINILLEDFDNLLKDYNNEYIAIYMAVVLSLKNTQKANEYFLKSVNSLNGLKILNNTDKELPEELNLESIIWITGSSINSTEDVLNWINTLKQLSTKQLESVFRDEIAEHSCFNVINLMWLQERKKENPDWILILGFLNQLTDFACEKKLELLWACTIRVRIIILAENQGNIDAAIQLAEDSIKIASENPNIQFIIKSVTGHQLIYEKRYPQAIKWLTDALAQNTDIYPYEKISTFSGLSEAFMSINNCNFQESIKYSKEAVDFSKKSKNMPDYYLVKVLGEYIITLWETGQIEEAFCPFEESVNILLSKEKDTNEWKEVFTIFGHVSGYIVESLKYGTPPDKTRDGEPYAPPYRRIFLNSHPLVVEMYNKEMDYVLAIHTYWFAEKIGKNNEAKHWAIRAYEMGIKSSNQMLLISDGFNLNIYLLNSNRYEDALKICLDCTINLVRRSKNQQTEKNFIYESITYEQEDLSDIREETEKRMLTFWAIPSLMKISTINLTDPMAAKEHAKQIIDVCLKIKETASHQILWDNISNLFNAVFIETKDYDYFINHYNDIIKSEDIWIKVFYYIGSVALSKNIKDIIKIQLICAPVIDNEYKIFPSIYRAVIGDYFKLFWIYALSRYESKFIGVIWKMRILLEKYNYLSDDLAIKKILGVVSSNLDIDLDTKMWDWLEI